MPEPRKRKQHAMAEHVSAGDDIPLAHPKREESASTTLVDLIAERSNELSGSPPNTPRLDSSKVKSKVVSMRPGGQLAHWPRPPSSDEEMGPLGEAMFYGLSLAMIHFTLDVLVHNQFAEQLVWYELIPRSLTGLVVLFLLVYYLHPNAQTWWAQMVFLAGSVTAGCYLITTTSKHSYLAVMRQAPPLGTLWIWAVVEQSPGVALVGLLGVGGYFWWGGYSILS
jgi:hypothetical protein